MVKIAETFKGTFTDAATGKTIERELNPDELLDYKAQQVQALARETDAKAKADARTSALAKLAKLGLTKAEIEAL